jgi:hypothetical protein
MFVLEKKNIFFLNKNKSNIPRIDAITIIKSNIFHGIVKYLKFNAINFIIHSIVYLNKYQDRQIDYLNTYIATKK